MKKIITMICFLAFSSFAIGAEDGTGQGKASGSNSSESFAYCNFLVLNAEDGTGQVDAEDGTGQSKAEDGTGQGKYPDPRVELCKQLLFK